MRKIFGIIAVCSAIGISSVAQADAESAKTTASGVCAGCHGAAGISAAGTFPNLAGQKKEYLAASLKAYRDKSRNNAIMNSMAASLKDQDIDDLAAYFASLKACP